MRNSLPFLTLALGLALVTTAGQAQALPDSLAYPSALAGSTTAGPVVAGRSTTVRLSGKNTAYTWASSQAWASPVVTTTTYTALGLIGQEVQADSAATQPTRRKTYTYNAAGKRTSYLEETWSGGGWQNLTRTTTTYDSRQNFLLARTESWVSGAWQNTRQVTATYDSYNNPTSNETELWDATAQKWNLSAGTRRAFTYNAAGYNTVMVTDLYSTATKQYAPYDRVYYSYPSLKAGAIPSSETQRWQSGAYVNSSRYLTSFDAQDRLSSAEIQNWNGTAWEKTGRSTFLYSEFSTQQLSERYVQNAWVNGSRNTTTFNTTRVTAQETEDWRNGAWVLTSGTHYTPVYSAAGDMVRLATQTFNATSNRFVNVSLITYGDFQSVTLGLKANAALAAQTQLYPNPTAGQVTLELPKLSGKAAAEAEVVNSLGQVVQRLPLQAGRTALDLSAQPAGLYTVRLHTSAGLVVKKVVRQ